MPPETEKKSDATEAEKKSDATEKPEYLTVADARAMIDGTVNSAITGHLKRSGLDKASLERLFADSASKLLEGLKPKAEDPAPDAKGAPEAKDAKAPKVDPETKLLKEQLEKLTRKTEEAEARARATELGAKKDRARATVLEQLGAMGIKGAKARAVLHDLEATGALRFDAEGKAALVTKRARAKGAEPDEQEFEDLGRGLKDWSQGDDAKDFLPAPAAPAPRPGYGNAAPAGPSGRAAPAKPALTEAEALARTEAQLAAQGADVDALFTRG